MPTKAYAYSYVRYPEEVVVGEKYVADLYPSGGVACVGSALYRNRHHVCLEVWPFKLVSGAIRGAGNFTFSVVDSRGVFLSEELDCLGGRRLHVRLRKDTEGLWQQCQRYAVPQRRGDV